MPIRQFKPVTKSSRFRSVADFSEITRSTPEKSLLEPIKKSGGRDNHGHISMRRIGGGHKRKYRIIDFKRNRFIEPATVRENRVRSHRSARIARVEYGDGEKRYIIHPRAQGRRRGSPRARHRRAARQHAAARSRSARHAVHNIELKVGKGGHICRSAGMSAQVMAKECEYVTLRMPSPSAPGAPALLATIGEVGNAEHDSVVGRRERAAGWDKAPEGARRGDEPRRPPARRPPARRTQRRQPVGQEGGREDAQQEEAVAADDRPRAEAR